MEDKYFNTFLIRIVKQDKNTFLDKKIKSFNVYTYQQKDSNVDDYDGQFSVKSCLNLISVVCLMTKYENVIDRQIQQLQYFLFEMINSKVPSISFSTNDNIKLMKELNFKIFTYGFILPSGEFKGSVYETIFNEKLTKVMTEYIYVYQI